MTILEFDKNKKLLTPWPIQIYGDTAILQLEFDLPACACFQSINSIKLDVYKKGNITEEGKLVSSEEFSMLDATTWSGEILFKSDALYEYLQSMEENTATMDAQFTFMVGSSAIVTSQVFYIKAYIEAADTDGHVFLTKDEIEALINEHAADDTHLTDEQKEILENVKDLKPYDKALITLYEVVEQQVAGGETFTYYTAKLCDDMITTMDAMFATFRDKGLYHIQNKGAIHPADNASEIQEGIVSITVFSGPKSVLDYNWEEFKTTAAAASGIPNAQVNVSFF